MSKNIASESKRYKWGAKQLSMMALFKQYLPLIVIAVLAIIIIIIRFVW